MSNEISIEVVERIAAVDAADWNRLVSPNDPFTDHAFLEALETSGSVGAGTGWTPCHVLARQEERLVGAVPLYLKTDSYGEYIFDWGWAGAAQRAGVPYYPKLVSAVPFTPATGRRLLIAEDAVDGPVFEALVNGVRGVAEHVGAQSIHFLFVTQEERTALARIPGFLPRLTSQFHWKEEGDASYDEYLGRLRAPARKQIRRERRQADSSGLRLTLLTGDQVDDVGWESMYRFYRTTTGRKGAIDYLTEGFFHRIRETFAENAVLAMAHEGDRPVAGSISFEKGSHLYGRYWGALAHHEGLHFELCYHALIERAILKGHARFEAGAQGAHKIRRGLMPAATHSVHWIRHPGLRDAIAEHLVHEIRENREEMARLNARTPFKRPNQS